MPLIEAYVSAWQRSFEYGGRSNRADFWWFVLANIWELVNTVYVLPFLLRITPDPWSGALRRTVGLHSDRPNFFISKCS